MLKLTSRQQLSESVLFGTGNNFVVDVVESVTTVGIKIDASPLSGYHTTRHTSNVDLSIDLI